MWDHGLQHIHDPLASIPPGHPLSAKMSAEEAATANGTTLAGRTAIGISFGNSNSSIAYTTSEDKAEVIANEDGGMCLLPQSGVFECIIDVLHRSSNPVYPVVC